jgi:hypothetical protein
MFLKTNIISIDRAWFFFYGDYWFHCTNWSYFKIQKINENISKNKKNSNLNLNPNLTFKGKKNGLNNYSPV